MNILAKTYKPCANRVLIKFVPKAGSTIVLPDGKNAGSRIIVQAVGPDVKCCAEGDEVVVTLGPEMIGVEEAEKLAIVPDSYIAATIEG